MIYIIDGIDCSGKSTLIDALAEKTEYSIVKGSSFELASKGENAMFEHMMWLLEQDNVICDRFFYSNFVYAQTHEFPLMTDEQFDLLNRKLNEVANNVCLIYLYANEEIIKERIKIRGDNYITENDVSKIFSLYDKVLNRYRIPEQRTIKLDTGKIPFEDMSKVATTIINYTNRLSEMPERRNF